MGGRREVENEVRHRDCRSTDGTSVLTVYYIYIYIQQERIANSSRVLLLTLARRRKRERDRRPNTQAHTVTVIRIKQLRGRTGVCVWKSERGGKNYCRAEWRQKGAAATYEDGNI